MGLKYELTEAPPEELKSLYKETNGKFVLDVEGVVPQTKLQEVEVKLTEFRNNNVTLKQQLEAAVGTSLKGKQPSEINVEQILEQHVAEMRTNYETKVNTLTQSNATLQGHLERVVLSDSVKTAATEYGVLPSALPDVLNRAKEMFEVHDGQAVSKEKKLDKDGKPYSVQSWIQSLSDGAPHLFAQSRGSGSQTPIRGKLPTAELKGVDLIAKGLRDRSK